MRFMRIFLLYFIFAWLLVPQHKNINISHLFCLGIKSSVCKIIHGRKDTNKKYNNKKITFFFCCNQEHPQLLTWTWKFSRFFAFVLARKERETFSISISVRLLPFNEKYEHVIHIISFELILFAERVKCFWARTHFLLPFKP